MEDGGALWPRTPFAVSSLSDKIDTLVDVLDGFFPEHRHVLGVVLTSVTCGRVADPRSPSTLCHAQLVVSTHSLFMCAAADVTVDRVRALVKQNPLESLTHEYKEKYSPSLVKSVAAMANSYGGLIVVGVTDKPNDDDRLVGVSEEAITQITSGCHTRLEPPWEPEILVLPLPEKTGRYLLVIRVFSAIAPRPVLLDGAAPIRLNGRNATADRMRLAQLFSEVPQRATWAAPLPVPQLASAHSRMDALFILRSGLRSPVGPAAAWQPLSERAVRHLGDALEESQLTQTLRGWSRDVGMTEASRPFHRRGLNRARRVRLARSGLSDLVDVVLVLELPETYGAPVSELTLTLDIVAATELREQTSWVSSNSDADHGSWRLSVLRLRSLVTVLLAVLVDPNVVNAVAGIAGVDPVVPPQPTSLAFRSKPDVKDLLETEGLTSMIDRGSSHGADAVSNPAYDLRERRDLDAQVDDWLAQIGLDAGLLGMERLLDQPGLPPGLR